MKDNQKNTSENWSKDDLRVYIMLYCANADLEFTEEEKEYIQEKTQNPKYKEIKREFDNDNDYQGMNKITDATKRLGYSKDQINDLLSELKELFWVDGEFDIMEHEILHHIKRMLS